MANLLADITSRLLEYFTDKRVGNAILKECPTMDMVRKTESFKGKYLRVPVVYGGLDGTNTFSVAQSNERGTKGLEFQLTTGRVYGVVRFDDHALEAARDRQGDLLDEKKLETDSIVAGMGNKLAVEFWGNGGAPVANYASGTAPYVLTNLKDVQNLEVGTKLKASAGDGSSSGHSLRSGTLTVTGVNRGAGSFTATGTITGLAADDYFFVEGSFAGDTLTGGEVMKGVQAWLPASDPSSTLFFGVDRTVDTRLSGYRLPSSLAVGTIEERLKLTATRGNLAYGAKYDLGVVDPLQWERFSIGLQNKGVRAIDVKNSTGTTGYKALTVMTGTGELPVIMDRHAPVNRANLFTKKNVELCSMRAMVHIADKDGLRTRAVSDAMQWEMRFVGYNQLNMGKEPWTHATCSLAAAD